jgi:polyhydroxyalkanoate synthase
VLKTARRARHAFRATRRAARLTEGATRHRVVWSSGTVSLRHYPAQRTDEGVASTPLLLVTPIINRFRVVDLQPGGSLVESLTLRGIDVYVVDWGTPRRIDSGIDFEDYVLRYLRDASDAIPAEQVDLLGYCLGGTLGVMFAARFPERVRRLVTLTTPVDFSVDRPHMDLFRLWTDTRWFPVDRLTRAYGNMPGRLILQGFLWVTPMVTAFKFYKAWQRFDDAEFAEKFTVLEAWNQDSVDVPGAAYRRLIGDLYQGNKLASGTFELAGQPVDLKRIRCPLLVITGKRDTTCPPESATALMDLVSSRDKEHLQLSGGHVAPVVGTKARARLHDPLADWLRRGLEDEDGSA